MGKDKGPLVVVVGALNVDLGGRAKEGFTLRDSIPGKVEMSLGGVGYNLSSNLSSLGLCVHFITALGEDAFGRFAKENLAEGLSLEDAFWLCGAATGTYLFINDDQGDLVAAVNEMDIVSLLTPERLSEKKELIASADLLVIDANLPRESILWLCEVATCPVVADPVSAKKAGRLLPALPYLAMMKPNELELGFFTGMACESTSEALQAAKRLCEMGPELVFASLGARGMVYACKSKAVAGVVPPLARRILSTNGAGDYLFSLLILCLLKGISPREAAWMASRGVAGKLEGTSLVPEQLAWSDFEGKSER